jgi:hypothetical protein
MVTMLYPAALYRFGFPDIILCGTLSSELWSMGSSALTWNLAIWLSLIIAIRTSLFNLGKVWDSPSMSLFFLQ